REDESPTHIGQLPDRGRAERADHRSGLRHRAHDAKNAPAPWRGDRVREESEPRRVVRGQRRTGDKADRVKERLRQSEEDDEAEEEYRDRRENGHAPTTGAVGEMAKPRAKCDVAEPEDRED